MKIGNVLKIAGGVFGLAGAFIGAYLLATADGILMQLQQDRGLILIFVSIFSFIIIYALGEMLNRREK